MADSFPWGTINGMELNNDLMSILGSEHEEKWVALSKDRQKVIDFSADLLELRRRIGETNENVVYMKMLPSNMEFAFF